MKHNDGEWKAGENHTTVISDSASNLIMGVTEGEIRNYGGFLIGESISPCNINIIVNAPAMLKALELMIDSFGHYDLELSVVDEEGMQAIKQAKEAIQKAKS